MQAADAQERRCRAGTGGAGSGGLQSAVHIDLDRAAGTFAGGGDVVPLAVVDVRGGGKGGVRIADAEGDLAIEQRQPPIGCGAVDLAIDHAVTRPPLGAGAAGAGGFHPQCHGEVVLDRARNLDVGAGAIEQARLRAVAVDRIGHRGGGAVVGIAAGVLGISLERVPRHQPAGDGAGFGGECSRAAAVSTADDVVISGAIGDGGIRVAGGGDAAGKGDVRPPADGGALHRVTGGTAHGGPRETHLAKHPGGG